MSKFRIDKSYIRGFGDADGYVCKSRPLVVFVNTNKLLLKRISRYLDRLNIHHRFYTRKSKNKNHSTAYRIEIYRQTSVLRYLQEIGFCHPQKLKRLVETIEGCRCVDWEFKRRAVFRLHKKGLSIRKIADLVDIHFMTVFRYLHKK